MKRSVVRILPMSASHCAIVARLHREHLASRWRGRLGELLLRAQYRAIAKGSGACGYVAESERAVAGYVCGVWDGAAVRSAFWRSGLMGILLWLANGLTQGIAGLRRRLRNARRRRVGDVGSGTNLSTRYELRPIVVGREFRGSGIADHLVEALVADARSRGFDRIWLKTEVGNAAANRFYVKSGFTRLAPRRGDRGQYVYYERSTVEHRDHGQG